MTGFSLIVDDIDKEHARLRELGCEFLGLPKKEPWGSYAILLGSFIRPITLEPLNPRGKWAPRRATVLLGAME